MSPVEQFDQALRTDHPLQDLREAVRCLLAEGHDRQAVMAELERFRSSLRQQGREADEDLILEVLDFLAGWCSPHVAL